ncbi:hypothetical protein LSO58_06975 [Acinetobacter ursingii]|uniref:Uncharacterized protein n=1 Tax=Acinetobacter ursingii TaxID=108980 RepID=A0AA46P845_9GAMM|nr:hypothetical protein [Acinetobacter ursingii]UYF76611.1 hypothetical protein LSO58_06975 [Acinetobacter ursingii]
MREIARVETMPFEQQLILTLQTMYAPQFAKHFDGKSMDFVESVVKAVLSGVDQEGFNKGIARLLSGQSKFMPTIQEFKSWCVSGTWTAIEAWYHVCEWSKDSNHKITVMAKQCWDEVYHIVLDGNMREAKSQFMNLYEERLTRAQLQGVKQEVYVAPKAIPVKTFHTPYLAENKNLDQEKLTSLKKLAQQYQSKGMSVVAAFNQASIDLTGKSMMQGGAA